MAMRKSTWRDAALREMGLGPIWRRRDGQGETPQEVQPGLATLPVDEPSAVEAGSFTPPATAPVASSRRETPAQASARDSGIDAHALPAGRAPAPPPATPALAEPRAQIETLDWDALEADIRACRACVLCERRKQAVPGVGDRQARWMLVGEGPGAEEDQRGEPFVGQAGRLLDNMLAALGLNRSQDVYIANAVKCRPPHNRTPERSELSACLPYLDRQIALVQPRLLVALGRPAAQALLERELAISAARGKRFERKGIPVVVTYHPAYLLRNPQDKAKAWEDLCFARRVMMEEGS